MATISELLENAKNRDQAFDEMIDAIKASNPADRVRFAVQVCTILDKSDTSEAFTLLVDATRKEGDTLVESFKGLRKDDQVRVTAKLLFMVGQDMVSVPRRVRANGNGEASIMDVVLNCIGTAKGPITRKACLEEVRKVIPDVNEDTVRASISNAKEKGLLIHHEELHAYTLASA